MSDPTPQSPKQMVDRQLADVYREVRAIVGRELRREWGRDISLRPTEIVHETYVRLAKARTEWQNEEHLRARTAKVIRDVLVDHARSRAALKHGGGRRRITLAESHSIGDQPSLDLLDLHESLERLAAQKPRQARVVELRFFGNLTFREVAEAMGIVEDTAKEHWAFARAWLLRDLQR